VVLNSPIFIRIRISRVEKPTVYTDHSDPKVGRDLLSYVAGEPEDFPIEIVKRILVCGIAAGTDTSAAVNTKSNAVR
jgi:hypothetical protein